MLVEISPATYLALCGLVRDALECQSDATPILKNAEKELTSAMSGDLISSELVEQPVYLENLRRAGFARR